MIQISDKTLLCYKLFLLPKTSAVYKFSVITTTEKTPGQSVSIYSLGVCRCQYKKKNFFLEMTSYLYRWIFTSEIRWISTCCPVCKTQLSEQAKRSTVKNWNFHK